jgi:hypothetical protein
MTHKIVYKAIYASGDGLLSVNTNGLPASMIATYVPGEWTEPSMGYLFAFSRMIQAERFLRLNYATLESNEIWEAEAEIAQGHIPTAITPFNHSREQALRFWIMVKRGDRDVGRVSVPEGTMFCSKIKLVRRVL